MKHISAVLAALLIIISFSCYSVPKSVPEDLTKEELIQLAQDAYDDGNEKASIFYYQTIIERFGEDIGTRITAMFEIAHIYTKAQKWDEARPILEEIIAYFDTPDSALTLPQAYKKLAIIDWKKLPENSAL
ncbi:MAG: hypothetical protein K5751_07280 [Treponemataceae bacterium]|nr:hypothetical protein [Treponemataceae bacterium]